MALSTLNIIAIDASLSKQSPQEIRQYGLMDIDIPLAALKMSHSST